MSASLKHEDVVAVLAYEPIAGTFRWKCNRPGGMREGSDAGHLHSTGYLYIGIGGRRYRAHRLAWLIVTGTMPTAEIDHINGNPSDNRIISLRDVSRAVNAQNIRVSIGSKSGFLGVSWHPQAQRWKAKLQTGGKQKHIGYFDTPEQAHVAYLAAKRMMHEGCTI